MGKGWGAARFSEFDDGVGKYRNCSVGGCKAWDAGCKTRQRSRKSDCERLRAIEIELAAPVAVAIARSRDSAERAGVRPIPDGIRTRLKAFFPAKILNAVRYRVGATDELGFLKIAFQWQATSAIVMDDVIFFKHERDALHNVRLWAHELEHVIQYEMLGIDGFAQRWLQPAKRGGYDGDRTTIEGAAVARSVYVCSHIKC